MDQKKGEKYGLGKSNQPELGKRDNSHRDLILAASRKVLGWVVPRDELDLINGALPLGCKALAPGGGCLVTTTAGLPRSSCLGRIVGGGMRVFHHHVMVVKHGGAAGTDIGLRKSLLMAQVHLLEGTRVLMETLWRKQVLLRMQVLPGEKAVMRYDTLSWNGVVVM